MSTILDDTKGADMLEHFAQNVMDLDVSSKGFARDESLHIVDDGSLSVFFAPFDHINENARIMLVGLTPGQHQAEVALAEAKKLLLEGLPVRDVLRMIKSKASFSGPLRQNLVDMLDYLGVNRFVEMDSVAGLFDDTDFVHFTSLIRYPVFIRDSNYSGSPSIARSRLLQSVIEKRFVQEDLSLCERSVIIPLGAPVGEYMERLVETGRMDSRRVLFGLPHPSGANAERISYFLERKSRDELSSKTNADLIDRKRAELVEKISKLRLGEKSLK